MKRRWLELLCLLIAGLSFSGGVLAKENTALERWQGIGQYLTARQIVVKETEIVIELYEFAQQLNELKAHDRIQQYQRLERVFTDCNETKARLKLALVLSAGEADLARYELARKLFEICLAEAQGPILNGYIHSQLVHLDRQESRWEEVQTLRNRLEAQQHKNEALQQRVKDLEAQMEALKDIEQSLKERGRAEEPLEDIEQGPEEQEQAQ